MLKKSLFSGFLLVGAMFIGSQHTLVAQTPIDPTLEVIQQWVETERRIASERAAWETDKAASQNLLEVYQQELEMLREQIDAAQEDTSAAESARAELNSQDQILRDLENQVLKQVIQAEIELRALYAKLPEPLRQELRPLFAAIPENPATSTLAVGQRMQPVAAMLTQIQKFNGSVTVVDAFREFEVGSPVQIESIYFGLGAAFYVDKANAHAGVGVMGPNGWEWRDDPSIAPVVRNFLEIYRGTRQAQYVFLPVEIQR